MELSYFLAELFGLTLIIYAVALFRKPVIVQSMIDEIGQSKLSTLLASFVGVIGGLAIILLHNVWVMSWPFIITLFGWAALLKGVTFLVAPQALLRLGGKLYSSRRKIKIALVMMLVLGVYLTAVGFKIL